MKPVPQNKLHELLGPIFASRIEETGMADRTSKEYLLTVASEGYVNRTAAAYVDDLEDPKSCLVVGIGKNLLMPAKLCFAYLFWIDPEERGKHPDKVADMINTMERWADLMECEEVSVASWVFRGSEGIDAFWKQKGFEKQEVVYMKNLKGGTQWPPQ